MHLRMPHLYYGWTVVAIGFITMMLIMGIFFSSGVLFAAIIAPTAQSLVDASGWRVAYTLLGIAAMACLVPLNAIWQCHKPADLGLHPDGATAPPTRVHSSAAASSAVPWTLWQAVGTRHF